MVLLTMTFTIVDAIKEYQSQNLDSGNRHLSEPPLESPAIGNPISHGQLIDISRALKQSDTNTKYRLDNLIRSSQIYIEPPKPKPEPSSEYKALMARLRRAEEERQYAQMVVNRPALSNPMQRLVGPDTPLPGSGNSANEDEMTFADVNRQMAVIINVLVRHNCLWDSNLDCGAALEYAN